MKTLVTFAALVIAAMVVAAGPVQPAIKDGTWHIPFRYWAHISPALDSTGGFDFLCEVESLGKDIPPQDEGQRHFKGGTLKVLEVLHADTTAFPAVTTLKTLHVQGCEGLQVGDRLLLFVDGEPYEGGYVIDHHRGTNCLIGHRLARPDEDGVNHDREKLLIEMVRKGKASVTDEATPDELRALAMMDPAGVAEALVRRIEMGHLIKGPGVLHGSKELR